jgi:predicted transcriptional regulator
MGAPGISDNAAAIRSWLMAAPRPKKIQVYARDGKEYEIKVLPNAAWSETATSIEALDPERLEATADDSTLIRAVSVADLIKKEQKAQTQQAAVSAAMTATDPETQRMIVFAELLEKAYAKAYESSQQTVQVAFTQLQEICGSLAEQASHSNQAANELTVGIRNLLIQNANERAAELTNAPEPSPLEKFAGHFLTGATAAEATQPAAKAAKPNGKH